MFTKKKMKNTAFPRNIITVLFLLVFAVAFAGCGSDTEDNIPEEKAPIQTENYDVDKETDEPKTTETTETTTNTAKEQEPSTTEVIPEQTEEPVSQTTDISQIPPYAGDPIAVLNNNIPNFTESDLLTLNIEFYSELDDLGRCGYAYACICTATQPPKDEERGKIGMVKPSGWHTVRYNGIVEGNYLYNRCHLIGWQLAGENANEKNLITGTRYLNNEGMLPYENKVDDYIETHPENHVLYRVTPIFEGNNLVASGVQMEAKSVEDDGCVFNIFCYNVQPNIVIDYADGTSSPGNTDYPGLLIDNSEELRPLPSPETEQITPDTETPPLEEITEQEPQLQNEATTSQWGETTVWIPQSGKKYHSYPGCSNMKNPMESTRKAAESLGYTPCSRCW